ncbi:MAG: hypothetical protein V9G20_02700 [Candidatus Promineifilaceae bacterium]
MGARPRPSPPFSAPPAAHHQKRDSPFHLRQQSHQLLIATRRGTPFHLQRLSPLPDETVVEGFDADI